VRNMSDNDNKKENLIENIKTELGLDEKQTTELYKGLYAAWRHYEKLKGVYSCEDSLKTYREKIRTAHDAIKKFNSEFRKIPEVERESMDTFYSAANFGDTMMIDLMDESFVTKNGRFSGIQAISKRIENALSLAEQNIPKEGENSSRIANINYIAGIEILADYFRKTCPGYEVSSSRESIFHRYALIWFNCFFEKKGGWHDVSRKLQKALDYPTMTYHDAKVAK
jgi:hypothetical protein